MGEPTYPLGTAGGLEFNEIGNPVSVEDPEHGSVRDVVLELDRAYLGERRELTPHGLGEQRQRHPRAREGRLDLERLVDEMGRSGTEVEVPSYDPAVP